MYAIAWTHLLRSTYRSGHEGNTCSLIEKEINMAGLRLLSLDSPTLRAGSQPASKDRDFWKVLLSLSRDGS